MKYFIWSRIEIRDLIVLDTLMEGSGLSILPYPHLGMWSQAVVLKIPDNLEGKLTVAIGTFKGTRLEEWKQ